MHNWLKLEHLPNLVLLNLFCFAPLPPPPPPKCFLRLPPMLLYSTLICKKQNVRQGGGGVKDISPLTRGGGGQTEEIRFISLNQEFASSSSFAVQYQLSLSSVQPPRHSKGNQCHSVSHLQSTLQFDGQNYQIEIFPFLWKWSDNSSDWVTLSLRVESERGDFVSSAAF